MSWDSEAIAAARQYHQERDAKRRAQREADRAKWLERAREAIRRLAPAFPALQRAYLFGAIVQPGRFRPGSDIDVAVECAELEQESRFWRAMEQTLRRDVDVRPYVEPIVQAVAWHGEMVYEREGAHPSHLNRKMET
jgi:predicted nucleotidyltransferase